MLKKAFRINGVTIFFLVILGLVVPNASAFEPQYRGGSNLVWYDLHDDCTDNSGTAREDYGILANYPESGTNSVRTIVQGQLGDMYNAGQRRLRIPVIHMDDWQNGTVVRSETSSQRQSIANKLELLLTDVANAGFIQVLIAMIPVGNKTSPGNWDWNPDGVYYSAGTNYQTMLNNLDLIMKCRQAAENVGIAYQIDLNNEGAPCEYWKVNGEKIPTHAWRWYTKEVWKGFFQRGGFLDETVGFSIMANHPGSVEETGTVRNYYRTVSDVYDSSGYGRPMYYSVHCYMDGVKEQQALIELDQAMDADGEATKGWIIGESYYNDSYTDSMFSGANLGNRPVWFILQWPLTRNSTFCDPACDVAPPIDFYNYM